MGRQCVSMFVGRHVMWEYVGRQVVWEYVCGQKSSVGGCIWADM